MLQNRSAAAAPEAQILPPQAHLPHPVDTRALVIPLPSGRLAKYLVLAGLFGLVVIYEKTAPDSLKLSALFGAFEGNTEAASLRAKLEATQSMVAMQNAERTRMENDINRYKADQEIRVNKIKVDFDNQINQYKASLDMWKENVVNQYNAAFQLRKEQLAMRLKTVMDAQQGRFEIAKIADMVAALGSISDNPELTQKAATFGTAFRQTAMTEIDQAMQMGQNIPPPPLPAVPAAPLPFGQVAAVPAQSRETSAPSVTLPLARVGAKTPELLVRSAPQKDGSSVLCVLPAGAVVRLLGPPQHDPAHDINFVQVGFDREGRGAMKGWISQWSLENVPATAPEGRAPQVCRDPAP